MNVLMISDEPERKSFGQILSLKEQIEGLVRNKVDSLVFSDKGVFLNKERIGKEAGIALRLVESLLKERTYGLIVISLELHNLGKLFPEKEDILDLIADTSPQTATFLFGASSILDKLDKRKTIHVFLYSRPGVSKLTKEFRNDVIDYIKRKNRNKNLNFSFLSFLAKEICTYIH